MCGSLAGQVAGRDRLGGVEPCEDRLHWGKEHVRDRDVRCGQPAAKRVDDAGVQLDAVRGRIGAGR